jgi:integrase
LFALGVYMFPRAGELAALNWDDIDLEHRAIHIHCSHDARRGRLTKATKTETARRIPIEPALVPLLEALRNEAHGRGSVVRMPSVGTLSTA